ncbi:MAG: protein kinase [Patescibacteria group bacterium]
MRSLEKDFSLPDKKSSNKFISLDREGQAENDKRLEDYLKKKILIGATKINEGHDGVIGLVNLDSLPPEIAAVFEPANPETKDGPNQLATKVLKIYEYGAGKQEFDMHRRAYDLVRETNSPDLIKIPQIYLYRQLDINEEDNELKKKLETDGIDTSSKKCDLMLMDFIPGDDFGSFLYKEVVKHASDRELFNDRELLDFREEIKTGKAETNLNRLTEAVDILIGVEYNNPKNDAREQIRIEQDNYLKIIKFLQQKGFRLSGEKFNKIKNTLNYLHKNGIYHRDLHERNIMVTYTDNGEIEDFYLVDFGLAIDLNASQNNEAYREKDQIYRDDDFILRVCEPLTKSPDDIKQEKKSKLLDNLEKTGQRLKKRLTVDSLWPADSLNLQAVADNIEKTVRGLTIDPDAAWEIRYAMIADLAKINVPLAKEYIQHSLGKAPLAVSNQLQQIDRLF